MLQSRNLEIKKFDNHKWIVNTPEGKNILMNERAIGLLAILNSSTSNQDAQEKFQEQFHQSITREEFEALVQNTFKGLNILSSEESTPYKKSSYLTLKVPLLNVWLAGLLASPLSVLFRPSFFWPAFICTLFLNAIVSVFSFREGILSIANVNVFLTAILVGASMLIHELGHIAACRQFGIKHGAIGFGFYFIFPVVYADITQVWNATKPQRIIANAGGIYTELIYSSVLLLFYIITKDVTFLLASVSIFIKTVTELNPFIRYDGYWLLSDISNTPNLMQKSNEALKKFFSLKKKKEHFGVGDLRGDLSIRKVLLISYGLTNTLLLVAYIIYVLLNFHAGITQFPALFLSLLQKAITLNISSSDFPRGFLWILGLYLFIFKIAVQLISKKIRQVFFSAKKV